MIKSLNEIEAARRARRVISSMKNLSPGDAALVLQKALGIVLIENREIFDDIKDQSVYAFNPNILRKRTTSKITNDIEIFNLVNKLVYEDSSISKITDECQKRFSEESAPSRSAIGRYVKKLKDELRKELAVNN